MLVGALVHFRSAGELFRTGKRNLHIGVRIIAEQDCAAVCFSDIGGIQLKQMIRTDRKCIVAAPLAKHGFHCFRAYRNSADQADKQHDRQC